MSVTSQGSLASSRQGAAPRRVLPNSPHDTASTRLDLPTPFGPVTAMTPAFGRTKSTVSCTMKARIATLCTFTRSDPYRCSFCSASLEDPLASDVLAVLHPAVETAAVVAECIAAQVAGHEKLALAGRHRPRDVFERTHVTRRNEAVVEREILGAVAPAVVREIADARAARDADAYEFVGEASWWVRAQGPRTVLVVDQRQVPLANRDGHRQARPARLPHQIGDALELGLRLWSAPQVEEVVPVSRGDDGGVPGERLEIGR